MRPRTSLVAVITRMSGPFLKQNLGTSRIGKANLVGLGFVQVKFLARKNDDKSFFSVKISSKNVAYLGKPVAKKTKVGNWTFCERDQKT
jgi:hypothetical protein